MTPSLLSITDLHTRFDLGRRGTVHAVNGVTFDVAEGEVVGVVGESGSGKSTVLRSIVGLVPPPGDVVSGRVAFRDRDMTTMRRRQLRSIRGDQIGFIAQNPFGALNPVLKIGRQFANIVRAHREKTDAEIHDRAVKLLADTGIPDPERVLEGYAHELSGGMAQRAVIAMALSLDPDLLLADEPTTALDVTVQRQILDTVAELVRRSNRSMLIVTHDLAIPANYCDRVIVMYAGQVVEQGPVKEVFTSPSHPYTQALLASVPGAIDWDNRAMGVPPDLMEEPVGCSYQPRCPIARDECVDVVPQVTQLAAAREVSCHAVAADGIPVADPPARPDVEVEDPGEDLPTDVEVVS